MGMNGIQTLVDNFCLFSDVIDRCRVIIHGAIDYYKTIESSNDLHSHLPLLYVFKYFKARSK